MLTDRQTQTPINTETHRPGTTSSHTSSQESVTGGMPIVKRHLNADFSLFTELLKITTTNIIHTGTFYSYAHTHTVTLHTLVYTAHARTSPE